LRVVRLVVVVVLAGFVTVLLRCRSEAAVDVVGFALPDSTVDRRACPAAVDPASTCVVDLTRTATKRDKVRPS